MDHSPLVSVVVITYNSASFVLETLESIKNQTYQNIELIISDDYSTDSTISLCKKWIDKNKDRFVRTNIITTPANTGIPANCNRGYSASQGDWIKVIAGDDLLLDNCVEENIKYIKTNNGVSVLFSKISYISNNKEDIERFANIFDYSFFNLNAKDQHLYLIKKGNCIPASTTFMKRTTFENRNFDERIKLLDDYPYWIQLTKMGIKLSFMELPTVKYRIHLNNISKKPSKKYIKSVLQVYFLYIFIDLILISPYIAIKKIFSLIYLYIISK